MPGSLTMTLRLMAKRWLSLSEELKALDRLLEELTKTSAGRAREQFGIGPQTAAILVAVARDNPDQLKIEAAIDQPTMPCGPSRWYERAAIQGPRHTLNGEQHKICGLMRITRMLHIVVRLWLDADQPRDGRHADDGTPYPADASVQ